MNSYIDIFLNNVDDPYFDGVYYKYKDGREHENLNDKIEKWFN